MIKKTITALLIIIGAASQTDAQYSLYKGNNSFQIGGYLTAFYNYRFYPEGTTDKHSNRFALDYGVVRINGMSNRKWFYEMELNVPALFDPTTSDGFMMQSSVTYKPLKDDWAFELGYDKVPFSRNSNVPNTDGPFLQRAEIERSGAFNRRDIGLTVEKSLLNKQLNVYLGTYTGMGAQSLAGANDPSGKLAYAARVQYSFNARYRYREIDLVHVPVPLISIGADATYAEKSLTSGIKYPYETLDGKKFAYSGDISAAYKGFSAHLEMIKVKQSPNDSTLLLGKPTTYFITGGFIAHVNYYCIPLKSVLAVRYDQYNPNDLVKGDTQQTLSFAYNYLLNGLRSCLKVQYFIAIKDKDANQNWGDNQMRIAWQFQF